MTSPQEQLKAMTPVADINANINQDRTTTGGNVDDFENQMRPRRFSASGQRIARFQNFKMPTARNQSDASWKVHHEIDNASSTETRQLEQMDPINSQDMTNKRTAVNMVNRSVENHGNRSKKDIAAETAEAMRAIESVQRWPAPARVFHVFKRSFFMSMQSDQKTSSATGWLPPPPLSRTIRAGGYIKTSDISGFFLQTGLSEFNFRFCK